MCVCVCVCDVLGQARRKEVSAGASTSEHVVIKQGLKEKHCIAMCIGACVAELK